SVFLALARKQREESTCSAVLCHCHSSLPFLLPSRTHASNNNNNNRPFVRSCNLPPPSTFPEQHRWKYSEEEEEGESLWMLPRVPLPRLLPLFLLLVATAGAAAAVMVAVSVFLLLLL